MQYNIKRDSLIAYTCLSVGTRAQFRLVLHLINRTKIPGCKVL
jgi:hypothetical protein